MSDVLVQIADIHFGAEHEAAIKSAIGQINEIAPDAIIVCGDLTQRGKRSEFSDAKNWLTHFDFPILVVPGNHDTPLLNLWTRMRSAFARYHEFFDTISSPISVSHGKITGLNTARGWQVRRNWAEGSVNLDALDNVLKQGSDAEKQPFILACHHPFLSPPKAPMVTATRRGILASGRIAEAGVEILLTGHVHTPSATVYREKSGQYLAISAGTLSTRLREYPPSFNVLNIDDEYISVSVYAFNGIEFDRVDLGRWTRKSLEPFA
ncbi:metallophosphoesterase family protein [Hirschia litorea]|uniref:Metallophosphoesterase family protein n=1 Tax=Hirschia litorea TaxID=1199156 RepID=A0ABW2INC4_9PROT